MGFVETGVIHPRKRMIKNTILAIVALVFANLVATAAERSTPRAEFVKLYHTWDTALCGADLAQLEKLYSDEARLTGPDGKVDTKQSFLAMVKSGEYKCSNPATTDLEVQVYGKVAVVTGVWTATEVVQGERTHSTFRFTDSWVKRRGQWSVVASQVTRIMPTK